MKLAMTENCWWGTSVDRVTGIGYAKQLGFEAYGIFMDGLSPELKRGMRERLAEEGLPVSSATIVATSLTDWNGSIRRATIDWLKDQFDVAYDFGNKKMIVVPGEYAWEKQEIKPDVQWQWLLEGLRELGDHARSRGMEIGLECETPTYNFLRTVDDLVRVVKEAAHPAVRPNVDLVHMFVVGDTPASLEKLKGILLNVHVADTNQRKHAHFPPKSGIVPLKDYLASLKKIGYRGAIEVELENSPEPDKILQWMRDGYSETAHMMDELGIRD